MSRDEDLNKRIRDVLPEEYKHCEEVVVHVSCQCFELVRTEAAVDTVLMIVLALILVALFVYAAYVVLSQTTVTAFDWTVFWLALGSLFALLALSVNKNSAVHKIKYKAHRNQVPWYEVSGS